MADIATYSRPARSILLATASASRPAVTSLRPHRLRSMTAASGFGIMKKMLPKSIQDRAKWYPGAFRKRPGEQIGSKMSRPGTFCPAFHATWAMLSATWEATGCRGGPKIEHSGTNMLSNERKGWMREGAKKTVFFCCDFN